MLIRQATSQDFPRIRDLDLGPGITTERDTVYALFFRLFPELCLVAVEDDEDLAGGRGTEDDVRLLGFALGGISSDGRECYLHDLWVGPEYRGRGIGHQLMERFVEAGRSLGAARVSLVTKGASRYYEERFGFQRATAADDPYVVELERHRGFCLLVLPLS
jgi:ribosomal protein S18 acetylase RimI-like enzyme